MYSGFTLRCVKCVKAVTLLPKSMLIIDDKLNLCRSLMYNFQRFDYQCFIATDKAMALNLFTTQDIDAVLLDVRLGEENGIHVLHQLQRAKSEVPVIMMTAFGAIQDAVESMRIGAYDYVQKPVQFNQLLELVERAISENRPRKKMNAPVRASSGLDNRIITECPRMIELCSRAQRLANSNLPVLIFGESGTGKELLADFIHASSPRAARDLVKVNCASFADSLLDNELFGHERGSFTGADSSYQGVFEQANGRTLFLDEVSDMTLATQAKILRAIQNQEIRRIGGKSVIHLDVRFIGATNRNIQQMIADGSFRQDLYYRLSTALLEVPPLRERRQDIPLLCDHFLRQFAEEEGTEAKSLSEPARQMLSCYDWPGNVRELKNILHFSSTIATTPSIRAEDLPSDSGSRLCGADPMEMLRQIEIGRIVSMLKQTNNNKKKTAELLRISRKTLYNKIEKYGIAPPG